ncbi:MAG TPA: hypothetical protein PLD56_00640 [Chitinophagales bacterium]|nr:hypothetical protein [Chitinophagales bacterium]
MIEFIRKMFKKDTEKSESIKDNDEKIDSGLSIKNGGTGKKKDLFDEEAHKKVYEYFYKLQADKETKCEVCNINKWIMQRSLVTPLMYDGYSLKFDMAQPCVSIVCDNCGNTKFINAIKIGILESNISDGDGAKYLN